MNINRREAVRVLTAVMLTACTDVSKLVAPPIEEHTLTMGVSVFCGWANPRPEFGLVPGVQCPWSNPWTTMKTPDRHPLLGEYDERELVITQQRLDWMQEGRVDFACYQIEWAHEFTKDV